MKPARILSDGKEIELYGTIGSWFGELSAKDFKSWLKGAGDVTLKVHSLGGSIFEGTAMHSMLLSHKGTVTAVVEGVAASMAALVVQAADRIVMHSGSYMMVHNPMLIVCDQLEESELRSYADQLAKFKEVSLDILGRRCKMSREELSDALDEETWFTAEEAVAAGLADEVIEAPALAAAFAGDPSVLRGGNPLAKPPADPKGKAKPPTPKKGEEMAKDEPAGDAGNENGGLINLVREVLGLQKAATEERSEARAAIAELRKGLDESRKARAAAELDAEVAKLKLPPKARESAKAALAAVAGTDAYAKVLEAVKAGAAAAAASGLLEEDKDAGSDDGSPMAEYSAEELKVLRAAGIDDKRLNVLHGHFGAVDTTTLLEESIEKVLSERGGD